MELSIGDDLAVVTYGATAREGFTTALQQPMLLAIFILPQQLSVLPHLCRQDISGKFLK
jgi:hypothetical protein